MRRYRISIIGIASLLLVSCGSTSSSYFLSNAPTGFKFTNTSGNTIDKIGGGSYAQLRDAVDNIIIQFTVNGDVDFANVVPDRNADRAVAHFPSASDKSGLTGNVSLFMPCNALTDSVRVCPQAVSLFEVANGCPDELTLTETERTSGNYTWDNALTRSDNDDCKISASVENFGTGAFGMTL